MSFKVYPTNAGNQNTTDKAATMKKILDSRKLRSVDCLLSPFSLGGVNCNRVHIARLLAQNNNTEIREREVIIQVTKR